MYAECQIQWLSCNHTYTKHHWWILSSSWRRFYWNFNWVGIMSSCLLTTYRVSSEQRQSSSTGLCFVQVWRLVEADWGFRQGSVWVLYSVWFLHCTCIRWDQVMVSDVYSMHVLSLGVILVYHQLLAALSIYLLPNQCFADLSCSYSIGFAIFYLF